MNLLMPALLMILYPLAPALRVFEIARFILSRLLGLLEDEETAALLHEDPEGLAALNRWLIDIEAMLNIVIGYLVRERLGLPFRDHRYSNGLRARLRPGKPLTFEDVFDRFERCVLMLADIDRLAARRAARIRRELDANPLRLLTPFASTSPAFAVEASDLSRDVAAPTQWGVSDSAVGAIWSGGPNREANAPAGASLRIRAPP